MNKLFSCPLSYTWLLISHVHYLVYFRLIQVPLPPFSPFLVHFPHYQADLAQEMEYMGETAIYTRPSPSQEPKNKDVFLDCSQHCPQNCLGGTEAGQ